MCRHNWRQLIQYTDSDTLLEDAAWCFYCTKCLSLKMISWDEKGKEVED